MLSSISPVGEHARGQRWWITVAAYTVGSAGAGAGLGLLLGACGSLLVLTPPVALTVLAVISLAGVAADLTVGAGGVHRQVDQRWLTTYRGWVYGLGFGAQLGVGVVTVIPGSIVWVTWAAALLAGSPASGATVGLVFGIGRALPLVAAGRVSSVTGLRRLMEQMARRAKTVARMTMAGQVAVGVVALASVIR